MSESSSIRKTEVINVPLILTSNGVAIESSPERKAWNIQNVGTNPLYVCKGTTASDTVFHAVLKGGTMDSDGTGGSVGEWLGVIYTGDIYVYGTSPKYVIMVM